MSIKFSYLFSVTAMIAVLHVLTVFAQITDEKTPPEKPAGETTISEKPLPSDESRSWATLGRLYVVIAADDQLEETVGQVAKKNGEVVATMFKNNVAPGAFTVIHIPVEQLTRQMIFLLISNLPSKQQDAICFYFSGKGGSDRKYGTFFALSQGKEELYRTELHAALTKKNCRLCVLVSDLSDGKVIPPKPVVKPVTETKTEPDAVSQSENKSDTEPKTGRQSEEDPFFSETKTMVNTKTAAIRASVELENVQPAKTTAPLFFSLFFQSTGMVDIISALPSQLSLPTDKGIGSFTETWASLATANKNKSLSWYRFFPYLKRGTALLFESCYSEGATAAEGTKQTSQTPVLLTLGQDHYDSVTYKAVYPHSEESGLPDHIVTDNELPLSDEGRNVVSKLIQESMGEIRPQNDAERGTHEDYSALDPDNTVNGADGEPFSISLASIKPSVSETVADTGNTTVTESTVTTATSSAKPRFGIQAAENKGDGIVITRTFEGLPGQRAGLKAGDVILTIDGKKITSEKEYSNAVDAAGPIMKLTIRNARDGKVIPLQIRLTP
ncbi:MAG: PDZ domain-containing protein [Planctomycetaceae bacterium]|jgi:hypothetical protein|nr:PDZ domain-containing protein [Planctomycetaceae bacterium]